MAEATDDLHLFQGFGIEIEYMIVAADSLDVVPACDWLMEKVAGEVTEEFDNGALAWNNELAMHVVEFKTNGPAATLVGLGEKFLADVRQVNGLLSERGLMLLPASSHPWMDPHKEVTLWPYGQREIYAAFDRIFGCSGHGWGNLQSMQINLPFQGDREFGALHAAIRLVLPLIPGLAASSPVLDGVKTGLRDARMRVYKSNCARVPSVTGAVIPEPIYTIDEYRKGLLGAIYKDLALLDPEGVLQEEWVNARGAIARFDRMAIEIRVIDNQENPCADLAFAELICGVVRLLTEQTWDSTAEIGAWDTGELLRLMDAAIEQGEEAEIHSGKYLRMLGISRSTATARQLWEHLADELVVRGMLSSPAEKVIEHYLRHGTLASRILAALPKQPARAELAAVYRRLGECLAEGTLFAARH